MAVIYILDTSELIVNDELIDKVEKKRQEKIRRIDNNLIKKEKLGAGLLLKELFDEYGIENQELIYNENGKPYLNTNEWYFSISHSSGVVIVSLSKNEIGIDIEKMKIYNPSLAKKIMNNDEYNLYEKLSELEKHKYFYQVWTAKEAIVKKRGTSITVNPANIIIDEDVITRRYIINKKAYMIASCGMGEFRVIEKRIEKE